MTIQDIIKYKIYDLKDFVCPDFTMAPARPLSLVWAAVNRMTAESKRFHMMILMMLMVLMVVMIMMLMMLMLMLVHRYWSIKSWRDSNKLKTRVANSILTLFNPV